MSKPYCTNCAYDLTGLPSEDLKITCPECCTTGNSSYVDRPFTYRELHKRYATRLLLPTTLPTMPFMILGLFYADMFVSMCAILIIMPFVIILIFMATEHSIKEEINTPPTFISKRTRWVWPWIYVTPSIVLYYIFYLIAR